MLQLLHNPTVSYLFLLQNILIHWLTFHPYSLHFTLLFVHLFNTSFGCWSDFKDTSLITQISRAACSSRSHIIHSTWKIHKSWSSDFFETENSLITFCLIFFCTTHVFPLKMLKSNPKCLFSLKKFLIFYWFLRPSLASFLFRNFLNFLTFPAWLAYKMITYIKKYVYYTIRVSR